MPVKSWAHSHACADCGTVTDCFERPKRAVATWTCPVVVAARVNRQGPFCAWCRGLRELMALCEARRWTDVQIRLEKRDGVWSRVVEHDVPPSKP